MLSESENEQKAGNLLVFTICYRELAHAAIQSVIAADFLLSLWVDGQAFHPVGLHTPRSGCHCTLTADSNRPRRNRFCRRFDNFLLSNSAQQIELDKFNTGNPTKFPILHSFTLQPPEGWTSSLSTHNEGVGLWHDLSCTAAIEVFLLCFSSQVQSRVRSRKSIKSRER